jgi:uncharacterized protein YkwD
MRCRPFAVALVIALAALLAPAAAPAAAAGCANADLRPGEGSEAVLSKATVCLINRERTRRRMRSLRTNKRLSRAAVSHTRDMIRRHYFEHESQTGQNVVDRLLSTGYLGKVTSWLVGENLAWGIGSRSSPRQIVTSWMNSPGHRRNMLNRRFREIGIGVVFSTPARNAPQSATYTTTFGFRK